MPHGELNLITDFLLNCMAHLCVRIPSMAVVAPGVLKTLYLYDGPHPKNIHKIQLIQLTKGERYTRKNLLKLKKKYKKK